MFHGVPYLTITFHNFLSIFFTQFQHTKIRFLFLWFYLFFYLLLWKKASSSVIKGFPKGVRAQKFRLCWEAHSSSKSLKPAENRFNRSGFTSFSMQVSSNSKRFNFQSLPTLHIQNLSNRCNNDHEFLAGFWHLAQLWGPNSSSGCGTSQWSVRLVIHYGQRD